VGCGFENTLDVEMIKEMHSRIW